MERQLRRISLAALMALVAMNVWIGGPLLALWIGSRVQASAGGLTLRPIAAITVFVTLGLITLVLMKALRRVSEAYDRAAGVAPGARRRDSWVSVERRNFPGQRIELSTLERILVVVVACAALAFEIWFFFFSTSPIDQRSGRSAVPVAQVRYAGETAGSQLRSAARIARVAGERFSV
jgi:hypothetical protein